MRARELAWGAVLIALALLIPLAFTGFLAISIPPFTATLASHVPSMISILLGPAVAVLVGAGSALGFLVTRGPVIAARAAMHSLFGGAGAYIYRRGMPYWQVLLLMLPVHALAEALIVLPFGFDLKKAFLLVGVGTGLHHLMDTVITLSIVRLARLEPLLGRARQ